MPLLKVRTKHQIQAEIDICKIKLDSLESWLHAEPWNSEARQDFRSTQDRLNSLLAEMSSFDNQAVDLIAGKIFNGMSDKDAIKYASTYYPGIESESTIIEKGVERGQRWIDELRAGY